MSENERVPELKDQNKDYKTGLLCILFCQLWWGFFPIYWQALIPIESWKLMLYRVFTMFVFSYAIARFRYSREEILEPMKDKTFLKHSVFAGLVLTANWSIYVWALTSERVIQTAIGYYIEPLVICAVGIIFFKEKLTKHNLTAMIFALVAILIMLVHYGQLPGVAIGLAGTWAMYSAIKKASDRPVLIALVYETSVYAVIALVGIIYTESTGIGVLAMNLPGKYVLMLFSGLATVIPVGLFGVSAKKVPLVVIGLLQYISPTITLLLGVFAFKEPIDKVQIISFVIIWIGLAIFTVGEFKRVASKTE